MCRFAPLLLLAFAPYAAADDIYHVIMAERVEYRESSEEVLWDLQGWHGGDYNKFWWKTEGQLADGEIEEGELQFLYSRAWTAFFDWQVGVRTQEADDVRINSAVIGLQGFARYRFETDVALFITEDGDALARAEFERDVLFSQKLILQPRAEVNLAFGDVPELGLGSGVTSLALEARLRYEVTRKFAPYVGVSWVGNFGDTADLIEASGGDSDETTVVIGLRFWF